MNKRLTGVLVLALAVALSAGAAGACSGTITGTFLYNGSGVVQPLGGGYLYLIPAQTWLQQPPPPPGVAFPFAFSNFPHLYGPSDSAGKITATGVGCGYYYMLFIRRGPLGMTPAQIYGPPKKGDYVWHSSQGYPGSRPTPPVYLANYATINLGAVYADANFRGPLEFCESPANSDTISGRVTGASGAPLAGWAVKITAVACNGNECGAAYRNYCGTSTGGKVYPAWTDSNGNYSITVQNGATYYVYAGPSFTSGRGSGWYPSCPRTKNCSGSVNYYPYCPIIVNGASAPGVNIVVPNY